MSGIRRRTKYRKHVAESADELVEPKEDEKIVRVVCSRGSNLLEVVEPAGKGGLCMIPTKFRKLIWIGRGSYLIVSEASGDASVSSGGKTSVRYMVQHVIGKDNLRYLKTKGLWPKEFAAEGDGEDAEAGKGGGGGGGEEFIVGGDMDLEDDPMFARRRRVVKRVEESESDDSSEEDDSSGEEEEEEEEEEG